jgi:hypothetical protein
MNTPILTAATGSISPTVGVNTFEVVDFDTPIGVVVEISDQPDDLQLVRRNMAGTGWQPVTDGRGQVVLNKDRLDAVATMPGVYGLRGGVSGSVNAYKVTV